MKKTKITPITKQPSLWALSPLLVFLCLYLVVSLIVNDFYKVPITVAFLVSSVYAVCITKGLSLNDRIMQYSKGAADKNIMLMIWIFVLAGAFAQSAKDIGVCERHKSGVCVSYTPLPLSRGEICGSNTPKNFKAQIYKENQLNRNFCL